MTNPNERVEAALSALEDEHGCVDMADALPVIRQHGDVRDGDSWGRWTYRAEANVLEIRPFGREAPYRYHVDLGRCETEADAWDWVRHVAAKRWATDADVGALFRGLRSLAGGSA